jgi:hypothetical protein
VSEATLSSFAQELMVLKRQLDLYAKAASAAAEGHYLDADQVLRKHPDISRRLAHALREVAGSISASQFETIVQERSSVAQRQLKAVYEANLREAELTWSGDWPAYVVVNVVRLTIDLIRSDASVDGKSLGTIEPTRVVPAVKQRVTELIDRPFDRAEFRQLLTDVYAAEASRQGNAFGTFVDIQSVYARIKSHFAQTTIEKQYTEAKFAVDLFRLRQAEMVGATARPALQLSPAQDASGGLYVPTGAGGNYIAALRFETEERHDDA